MANQFVFVNGIHNVFNVGDDNNFDYSAPKSEVAAIADSSSIMFMTSNYNDRPQGFTTGENHIWADGKLFKGTDTNTWREVKVNGNNITQYNVTNNTALDISSGQGTSIEYTNDKVVINANLSLGMWQGTQEEYDSIPSENIDPNVLYLITGGNDIGS